MRKVIHERRYITTDLEDIIETRLYYGSVTTRLLGSDDPSLELDVINHPKYFVPNQFGTNTTQDE